MSSTLDGKVALVTGASRGIGRAIAECFAQGGAAVVINCSSSLAEAEEVANGIKAQGGLAITLQADIGDVAQVRKLIKDTVSQLGQLDILVNNASVIDPIKPAVDVNEEEYDLAFGINTRGTFFAMQEAAKVFPEGGRIINISTMATTLGMANHAVYVASKSAVDQLTMVMATELCHRGITVNSVSPGPTDTSMLNYLFEENPDGMEAMFLQRSPMGRIAKPEDIADVVAFLASEDARWVTGQNLRADGGVR